MIQHLLRAGLVLAPVAWAHPVRAGAPLPIQGVPTVEFAAAASAAGEAAGTVSVAVVLSAPAPADVHVPFTLSGTAALPDDLTAPASPLVVPAGASGGTIDLVLADDALYELAEDVVIDLGAPVGATLGAVTTHVLTLASDDPPPVVSFAQARSAFAEHAGLVFVQVVLDAASGADVSVPFTVAGSAAAGEDYAVPGVPLVVPAGQTSALLPVQVVDDGFMESFETLVLRLEAPDHATLGAPGVHRLRIRASDARAGADRGPPRELALTLSATALDCGAARVGDAASALLAISNPTAMALPLLELEMAGDHAADFGVVGPGPFPLLLAPGELVTFDVHFTPSAKGPRAARLVPVPAVAGGREVDVAGTGLGPTAAEVLLDAGGDGGTASTGEAWTADFGWVGVSETTRTALPVSGTPDSLLLQTARTGAAFGYRLALPDGAYDVTLHFAELQGQPAGARVFDVLLEGAVAIGGLDVAAAVGPRVAYVETHRVQVAGGVLELDLAASAGEAQLNALEVRSVSLVDAQPAALDFGVVDEGATSALDLLLVNDGLHPAHYDTLRIQVLAGEGSPFSVVLDGQTYSGNPFDTVYSIDYTLGALGSDLLPVTFAPLVHATNACVLRLEGAGPAIVVPLDGISGFQGNPFLHPVIVADSVVVDYDGDGAEDALLDGSDSHTHEPGHVLTGWEWRVDGVLVSSAEVDTVPLALGPRAVELAIFDDNQPAETVGVTQDVVVVPVDQVPGVLATYHAAAPGGAAALLDAVPAQPDRAEAQMDFGVVQDDGVGTSGLSGDVMVRLRATVQAPGGEVWDLAVAGGAGHRLELDGVPVTGPLTPSAGAHALELRVAVDGLADLPVVVTLARDGGAPATLDPFALVHDQTSAPPTINDMTAVGSVLGGNPVVIRGFGFFPRDHVTVHWGAADLTQADFTSWSAEEIRFLSPPGTGSIQATVETPLGTSNARTFAYQDDGPVPIQFTERSAHAVSQPTAAAWGPDHRLWVVTRTGEVRAIAYDDDYQVVGVDTYLGVSGLTNHEAMGIAFDPFRPFDGAGEVRLFVAHNEMFAQGGTSFSGPAPYPGQVSLLVGPDFDAPVPVVTGLPTSNHDHGVNGMVFDGNGDLLICVGGNTNAGITWWKMGDLPESPLSAAIVRAELSRPDFDGALVYLETATGLPSDDQVDGEVVDVAPGTHVAVHAPGLRNPFDLCLTVADRLYATDNGPNSTYGFASTGPGSQTSWHPSRQDELLLVELDHYYGHPNRSRGRTAGRENVYREPAAPAVPGYTPPLVELPSSSNGLTEYRGATFGDQLRGDLFAMKFNAPARRVELAPDGRGVDAVSSLPAIATGLNLVYGPGGALVSIDYLGNRVRAYGPVDLAASGLTPYDVTPWRAPVGGGDEFVLAGEGFGTLADTAVTFDGTPAVLTSVGPRRIVGLVPARADVPVAPVDVAVTVAGETRTLPGAFRYLPASPGEKRGTWSAAPPMPLPLGEVACGVVGGRMLLVGEGAANTLAHDLVAGSWRDDLAVRPFAGHHHGAEVIGGKWYLVGGLGAGSEGKLQVYDPAADAWTLGAPLPWSGGSVSTAAIGGLLYAAGGIVGSTTVDHCAVYDPAADAWTTLASMPAQQGRNHAAAGTDGARFWVFGGRGVGSGAGNWVANGFDDVQVYDPATDTWESSADPGSALAPLPIGRGGTGKAVLYRGELLVLGGETINGPGAAPGNVYCTVHAYDPVANAWRTERPVPTARHGIFPVVYEGKLYVAGGGVVAGFSASDAFEVFDRQ